MGSFSVFKYVPGKSFFRISFFQNLETLLTIKTFKQKKVYQILDMLVKNMSSNSQKSKFAIRRGGTLFRAYTLANHGLIIKFLPKSKNPKKNSLIACIIIQLIYTQKIRSLSQRTTEK